MKTGFSINNDDIEMPNNLIGLMAVFMEDAIKMAFYYSKHSNREKVHKKDIIFALKTRAYHGERFWNCVNISQKIENMKNLIEQEITSTEDDMSEDEDEEIWTKSKCSCSVCKTLNNIDIVWNDWNPITVYDNILKNAVNKASDSSI